MLYFLYKLNISGWELAALISAYIVAIAFAIVAHEFSHAFVALKCGDPTAKQMKRVSLNPFNHFDILGILSFLFIGFGWAKPVPVNPLNFRNYNKGRRLVAVSGVITNFVLAVFFSAFYFFFSSNLIANGNVFLAFLGYLFMFGTVINLALAIFNLLPIFPLDGFSFLETFFKPDNKFVEFMKRYGSFILIIFIISPLFDIVYGYALEGIEYLLFLFWGLF